MSNPAIITKQALFYYFFNSHQSIEGKHVREERANKATTVGSRKLVGFVCSCCTAPPPLFVCWLFVLACGVFLSGDPLDLAGFRIRSPALFVRSSQTCRSSFGFASFSSAPNPPAKQVLPREPLRKNHHVRGKVESLRFLPVSAVTSVE